MAKAQTDARMVLSPGLNDAPVLDRLCSHFVLTLTLRQAGRFNLRRDCNSLLVADRVAIWSGRCRCWRGCARSCACAARAMRSGAATRR